MASIEQPVRRLRGFQWVTLEPGEIDFFVGDSSEAPFAEAFEATG